MKRVLWVCITVIILFMITANYGKSVEFFGSQELKQYEQHTIIKINNNTDLINLANEEGWNGSGTSEDPFIIENYTIESHPDQWGIYIGNVSLYLVLRRCEVFNATNTTSFCGGICIYNSTNILLECLNISNVSVGIFINYSENISLTNCNLHDYKPYIHNITCGIRVENSTNILVRDCVLEHVFIDSAYFPQTDLVGLCVFDSQKLTLENTTIEGHLLGGMFEDVYGTGALFQNISDLRIYNLNCTDDGSLGLIIKNGYNITVVNSTFSRCGDGAIINGNLGKIINCVFIYNAWSPEGMVAPTGNGLTISGNDWFIYSSKFNYNAEDGIKMKGNNISIIYCEFIENGCYDYNSDIWYGNGIGMQNSNKCSIINNTIKNNELYGIFLVQCSENIICNNTIFKNRDYGIYIKSGSHNRIHHNYFCFNRNSTSTYNPNRTQAYDGGMENIWNTSGTPHGYGNYWHDWANNNDTNDQNHDGIVDWPYRIDGPAGARDYYPMKSSPYTPEFSCYYLILIVIVLCLLFRKD